LLDDDLYAELGRRATRVADGVRAALEQADVPISVPVVGPLLGLHFSATPAVDYDTARTTDEKAYARFFHALLDEGVALAPGAYEVAFPGLAHNESILDEITAAPTRVATTLTEPTERSLPRSAARARHSWSVIDALRVVASGSVRHGR